MNTELEPSVGLFEYKAQRSCPRHGAHLPGCGVQGHCLPARLEKEGQASSLGGIDQPGE